MAVGFEGAGERVAAHLERVREIVGRAPARPARALAEDTTALRARWTTGPLAGARMPGESGFAAAGPWCCA
jgi:hypothetical protein